MICNKTKHILTFHDLGAEGIVTFDRSLHCKSGLLTQLITALAEGIQIGCHKEFILGLIKVYTGAAGQTMLGRGCNQNLIVKEVCALPERVVERIRRGDNQVDSLLKEIICGRNRVKCNLVN